MMYIGNSYSPYYNYLAHEGKKHRSGRYPWGSGDRPYQSEPGKRMSWLKRRKQAKLEKKEAKKIKPPDMKKEFQSKQEKADFLRTASSATELLQYRDQLTQKEMSDALDRIKTIRQVSDVSKKELEAAWNAVDDAMRKIGKMTDWGYTAVESVQLVQDIIALLNGEHPPNKGKKQQGQKKR